jgi:hypothetical protein
MIWEFKKGETLQVINAGSGLALGEIVVCNQNVSTDGEYETITVTRTSGQCSDWYVQRFVKTEKKGSKVKYVKEELFAIFENSCANFTKLVRSRNELNAFSKTATKNYDVFKMTKFATIERVTTLKILKDKKTKIKK